VFCENSQSINDSIVVDILVADREVVGCTYMNQGVVFGPMGTVDLDFGLEPILQKTTKNENCCIDKGHVPIPSQAIIFDYFGNQRPLGKGYDIGINEVE